MLSPLLSHAFLLLLLALLALPSCSCCLTAKPRTISNRSAAKARKKRLRNTLAAWQWRTERASGRRPVLPNVAFWSYKKLAIFCFCRCFLLLLVLAPGPSCSPFLPLLPDGHASNRSAAQARKKRLRHIQTAWQWRTERASGRWPVLPNVAFLLSLLALAAWRPSLGPFSCQGSKKAASPHSSSMAVKDGTGPRATACTA